MVEESLQKSTSSAVKHNQFEHLVIGNDDKKTTSPYLSVKISERVEVGKYQKPKHSTYSLLRIHNHIPSYRTGIPFIVFNVNVHSHLYSSELKALLHAFVTRIPRSNTKYTRCLSRDEHHQEMFAQVP